MNVSIKTIPHRRQRYPTVGDWFYDRKGNLQIRVSQMSDWRYEMLAAVHELVECLLCRWYGVSQKDVDKYDIQFEKNRPSWSTEEPGDGEKSPYRLQHGIATGIERTLAAIMGVSWGQYECEIESL